MKSTLLLLILVLTQCQDFDDIDEPQLIDSCPYGHYFAEQGCLQCLSTCPVCQEITFYDDYCPECGDGFKFNEEGTYCVPCEQNQLYCPDDDYYGDYGWAYKSTYWVKDGKVFIDEGDVVEQCDYCFINEQNCTAPKDEEKCGDKMATSNYDTEISDKNFMETLFYSLNGIQEIKESHFSHKICIFDSVFEQTSSKQLEFTNNVSIDHVKMIETMFKNSQFESSIYWKNSQIDQAYFENVTFRKDIVFKSIFISQTEFKFLTFEDNVLFRNVNFSMSYITSSTFKKKVTFVDCFFTETSFTDCNFTESVTFENCQFTDSSFAGSIMEKVLFNSSQLDGCEIGGKSFKKVTIQNSNLIETTLQNTDSPTVQNFQINYSYLQNFTDKTGKVKIQNRMDSAFQMYTYGPPPPLPYDAAYSHYKCGRCDKRCSICMDTRYHCLQCANGYVKEGWKCIKAEHIIFRAYLDAKRGDITKNLQNFKEDILMANGNYEDNVEGITIREIYEESNGFSVTGTVQKAEGQSLEQLKLKLSSMKTVGNMKLMKIQFGQPQPHGKGVFFTVLIIILSIVVFLGLVFCCCKFGKKFKNKVFKKEVTYEMYGEFRDESSSAK